MALDLIQLADSDRMTDFVVTELRDDPPFHKQMIGTFMLDGKQKWFSFIYNVNIPSERMDERLRKALEAFQEKANGA